MAIEYQTLVKLNWVNQTQLIDDLNRNFAIIENSPLYKGIPGIKGLPGDVGSKGVRGSRFFFAKVDEFVIKFKDNLTDKTLNLVYLNTLINNKHGVWGDQSLPMLKELWEMTQNTADDNFVEGDVVVLPSTEMVRYHDSVRQFVSTGISFNVLSAWEQTMFDKIVTEVDIRVTNDERLKSLQNIFKSYQVWGKQFSDDSSNIQPSNVVSSSTVFYPLIPGVVKSEGVLMDESNGQYNVRIITFNKEEVGEGYLQTTVLGDSLKYVNLLNTTIGVGGRGSYNADYALGHQHLPALLALQNDTRSGLMFGFMGNADGFYQFSHIYHGVPENAQVCQTSCLILKSHSSSKENEYSALYISQYAMEYMKYAHLGHDLRLDRNLRMPSFYDKAVTSGDPTSDAHSGLIDNGHIKTGRFTIVDTTSDKSTNYAGAADPGLFRSYFNSNGMQDISKTRPELFDAIYGVVDSDLKSLNKGTAKHTYKDIIFTQYPRTEEVGLVLVIDETNGLIQKDYFIDSNVLSEAGTNIIKQDDNTELNSLTNFSPYYPKDGDATSRARAKNAFASSDNINILAWSINQTREWFLNYWRKEQWAKYVIPTLNLNNSLSVDKTVLFGDHTDTYMQFLMNDITNLSLTLGYYGKDSSDVDRTTLTTIQSQTVSFPFYKSVVLVTDTNGKILKTHSLEDSYLDPKPSDPIPDNSMWSISGMKALLVADETQFPYLDTKIVTSKYVNWILHLLDSLSTNLEDLYWKKTEYGDNLTYDHADTKIPAITVKGAVNSMGLSEIATGANFDLIYGRKWLTGESAPTNQATTVTIGALATTLVGYDSVIFPNMARNGDSGYNLTGTTPSDNLQGVMTTNKDGNLQNKYTIEVGEIEYDVDGFIVASTFPDDSNHVATMNYLKALLTQIDVMIDAIPEIPPIYTIEQHTDGSITEIVVGDLKATGDTILNNTQIDGTLTLNALIDIDEPYHVLGIEDITIDEDAPASNDVGRLKAILDDGTNDDNTFVMPTSPSDNPLNYELQESCWDVSAYSIMTGKAQEWLIKEINLLKRAIANTVKTEQFAQSKFNSVPNGTIILWWDVPANNAEKTLGKITLSDGSEIDNFYTFKSWDEFGTEITKTFPRGWYPCCGMKIPFVEDSEYTELGDLYTPDLMQRQGTAIHQYRFGCFGFQVGSKDDNEKFTPHFASEKSRLRAMVAVPLIKYFEPNGDVWTGSELEDDSKPPDAGDTTFEREWILNIVGGVPTGYDEIPKDAVGLTEDELKKINVRVWYGVDGSDEDGSVLSEDDIFAYLHGVDAVEAYWYASTSSKIKNWGINDQYPIEEVFTSKATQYLTVTVVNNQNTDKDNYVYGLTMQYYGDPDANKATQSSTPSDCNYMITELTIPTDPYADAALKNTKASVYDKLDAVFARGIPQIWNVYIWKAPTAIEVVGGKLASGDLYPLNFGGDVLLKTT